MDQVAEQIKAHIYDKKFFTARGLALLSQQSGVAVEVLTQVLAGGLLLYLLVSSNAFFAANAILTVYPILVSYVFPDERPSRDLLHVYWFAFMAITIFDRVLEQIPCYYILKLALFAFFFLEPYKLAEKLNKLIEEILKNICGLTTDERRHLEDNRCGVSPRPEKPKAKQSKVLQAVTPQELNTARGSVQPPKEEQNKVNVKAAKEPSIRAVVEEPKIAREPSIRVAPQVIDEPKTAREPSVRKAPVVQEEPKTAREPSIRAVIQKEEPKTTKEPSIRAVIPPPAPVVEETTGDKKPSSTKSRTRSTRSVYVPTPAEAIVTAISPSTGLSDGGPIFRGVNPMLTDSSYRLKTDRKGIDNKDIGLAANLNDMLFFPMEKIVFNAPFDFDNLTYHMKIVNNAHHNIAFAIKGNCIPRVSAYPPSGILKPKEKLIVAVTVRKFNYNDFDYNKDRICFEYVLLKDKKADKFTHALLEDVDLKRRKNILICYNP